MLEDQHAARLRMHVVPVSHVPRMERRGAASQIGLGGLGRMRLVVFYGGAVRGGGWVVVDDGIDGVAEVNEVDGMAGLGGIEIERFEPVDRVVEIEMEREERDLGSVGRDVGAITVS